eukprot:6757203-Pyramimonas_sp.AAC.1
MPPSGILQSLTINSIKPFAKPYKATLYEQVLSSRRAPLCTRARSVTTRTQNLHGGTRCAGLSRRSGRPSPTGIK